MASLLDSKDLSKRNFSRPINAVALSPEYKSDRMYLSGGLAGNLVLTVGGKPGVANANPINAASAASNWLSSIGLGSTSGKDQVLHSGEGPISLVKWSLSSKFVVWTNEHGIKIMRTSLKLASSESDHAWTRIAHIDKPERPHWSEMAAVWKPRAEWIDDRRLETDDDRPLASHGSNLGSPDIQDIGTPTQPRKSISSTSTEKLIVGWGDTIWVLSVRSEPASSKLDSKSTSGGSASILHQ